jgi:putative FmdB family regulatory protein
MPLYEYECGDHGVFEETRSLAQSTDDAACPACRRAAPRIVSMPTLARMDRSQVKARDRNEQSRHEPKVVQRRAATPTERSPLRSAGGGYPWAMGH